MNLKDKFNKKLLIFIVILIPFGIASIISTIYTINYFNNKNDYDYGQALNLGDIDIDLIDMNRDFYSYIKPDYKTIIGVDLSEHNQDVDFKKLKDQGIEFVFLRIGWRGYLQPDIHLDKRFEEYYTNAKEVGMDIGVYFFSQAINEEEAIEEANFVISELKNKKINTYVVYDCESVEEKDARTKSLTKQQATANARKFLSIISDYGYFPMLYTNYDWTKNYYDSQILSEYPVWFAQYSRSPQYKGNHIIWQYASNMVVDGINGKDGTDLNLMIIKENAN